MTKVMRGLWGNLRQWLWVVFIGWAAGCGYTLQQAEQSPFFQKEGIHKVYVAPLVNNTYKPGVENLVYNQLVKVLASQRRVQLVTRKEDADAVLNGTVESATYVPGVNTSASQLFPTDKYASVPRGSAGVNVAAEYSGGLVCSFALVRQKSQPDKRDAIWSDRFAKSKPFPGNNQLGPFGTTSALINESEFDRALKDLAESMMSDLHESMLAGF